MYLSPLISPLHVPGLHPAVPVHSIARRHGFARYEYEGGCEALDQSACCRLMRATRRSCGPRCVSHQFGPINSCSTFLRRKLSGWVMWTGIAVAIVLYGICIVAGSRRVSERPGRSICVGRIISAEGATVGTGIGRLNPCLFGGPGVNNLRSLVCAAICCSICCTCL